ncbi:MAG TPA: hypothetical protein VJ724_03310 [Tahibacter sp.]|nr:hypothetical protein [Tahibacter sp.]
MPETDVHERGRTLKAAIAARLDVVRYLEHGSAHRAAGLPCPDVDTCALEADEEWRNAHGTTFTFDFDGWTLNLHYDSDGRFLHDTLDVFGHCTLNGFADVARPVDIAAAVAGAATFFLPDERVVLLPSGVTVHYRDDGDDAPVPTKISGAALPYDTLADYYRSMRRR